MASDSGAGPWRAGLLGWTVGVLLGWAKILLIFSWNPLFFDSYPWGGIFFIAFPGVVGFLVGLAIGALRKGGGPRRARRAAALATVLSLVTLTILGVMSGRREMNPSHRMRLAVVGVDGATWDIIDPMTAEGELPTFAELRREGTSGTCLSLLPMFSNRIFTSIATGKVAEKHGVVGVSDTALNLKAARIWDILGARDWVTGTMEWYVTWPPEERERGFTVPGLYARSSVTVPSELRFLRELRMGAKAGRGLAPGQALSWGLALVRHGLRLSTLVEGMKLGLATAGGLDQEELYYRQHYLWLRLKTDIFCRQLDTFELDFGGLVFKATDSLSHAYWKYHEPGRFSGVSPEEVIRYGDVIPGIYRQADEALARIARRVAPEGVLAVISDHGFQPATQTEEGISSLKTATMLGHMGLDEEGWDYVNIGGAACLMLREVESEEEHSRAQEDVAEMFRRSRVAGEEEPAFNVDPHDLPGMGDDYVAVGIRSEVVRRLSEELEVELCPGVTVPLRDLVITSSLSGNHALEGIIILRGRGVRAGGQLEAATVLDLTPTLLALVDLPVGSDMDGRVLARAIDPQYLAAHPVASVPTYDTRENLPRLTSQPETELPPDVREKLRSLGYIE